MIKPVMTLKAESFPKKIIKKRHKQKLKSGVSYSNFGLAWKLQMFNKI